MTLTDSDIGSNTVVTSEIGISLIRQGAGGFLNDRDMRHWHFLKLTCDIRTPRQGPQFSGVWPGSQEWPSTPKIDDDYGLF